MYDFVYVLVGVGFFALIALHARTRPSVDARLGLTAAPPLRPRTP